MGYEKYMPVRISEKLHKSLSNISLKLNCPLSELVRRIVTHSLLSFDKGHPLYKEISAEKFERDLNDAHRKIKQKRHLEFAVHNICKSIMQFAVQDYVMFGAINMGIVEKRFKDWETEYWKILPKQYKDFLRPQFAQVKAQYLDEDFLLNKVRCFVGDNERALQFDGGGKFGKKLLN